MAAQPADRAYEGGRTASAAQERAIMMQRYIVSATRIGKNPWRYASVAGFEVLSRASDEETHWEIDALLRGQRLRDLVLPKEWLPLSPVPYTVIMDDTNLDSIPAGHLHSQPIVFRSPADALTWGHLSDIANISTEPVTAFDDDTLAFNSNLYGIDAEKPSICSISLDRLFCCTPPLPDWLIAGLLGRDSGIFRESFVIFWDNDQNLGSSFSRVRKASGPGTLWISLDNTRQVLNQLKKDKKTKIVMLPLGALFAETPPSAENRALWESEAGLFLRWGLLGPGREDPVMSRAFFEFVRRASREPVTDEMFTDCFGFGYAAMEEKLASFLKAALAQPTSVDLDMPLNSAEPDMKDATADQIGRILGDWLRMKGDSLRNTDRTMSEEFLSAAGRVLERAYREDNGLPPDVDPSSGGERSTNSFQNAGYGAAVAMKPFVVTATRIHDPGLLAVYGLYEHDIGDDAKAREFLEAAVKAGAARPRAYLVLAELRYADAIARPLGSKGKLSAQQAASIIEPLQTASQYPPVFDIFRLIVDTWAHCEARPADRDVERIVEGVALFPRNTPLAFRSALVCAQNGYVSQAAALIDKGLLFASDESNRKHFEYLRSELALPASPNKK